MTAIFHVAGNYPDGERVRNGLDDSNDSDEESMGEVASVPVNNANETDSRLDEVFSRGGKDRAPANARHVRANETRHYALDDQAFLCVFHLQTLGELVDISLWEKMLLNI